MSEDLEKPLLKSLGFMMLKDKSLVIRIASALVAAAVILGIYLLFDQRGLVGICLAVSLLASREFRSLLFLKSKKLPFLAFYTFTSLLLILSLFIFNFDGLKAFGVSASLFATGLIILGRERVENEQLLKMIALGVFGLFYCVLCPWMAAQVGLAPHGPQHFLLLLLVVFFGDTFAYFGGYFFGKTKLNPSLSPKKTVEGSITGLFGSLLAAAGFWYFAQPDLSLGFLLLFGFLGGCVGQAGDLLMSLVKRVSQVKDSGRLLPGHGGILDRLDGVLLVCPLLYLLVI